MEQSQILVVDSLDRVGAVLERMNNTLTRIARLVEEQAYPEVGSPR